MIFYFTGTGNSLHAAKRIAEYHNDSVVSISEELKQRHDNLEYDLKDGELLGFVYPVYAWAPPKPVLDFIARVKINNLKDNYIFSIATCGDNVGNTMDVLKGALTQRGLTLHSGFSLKMPNNYIILGDVDSKEVEREKLSKAEARLKEISNNISEEKRGVYELEKGFAPWFLTGVINPLFRKAGLNTKKFYATEDCTGCGLCERVCSSANIKVDKIPSWGAECTQCLACIHRCPVRAIQYGKGTLKRGRYKNPVLG